MDNHLFRYSRRTFSSVCMLGTIAVLPFAVLRWQSGDILGLSLLGALMVAFCILAFWALSGRRIDAGPILLVPLACALMALIVLWRLREVGIYWYYPLIMAMAYVMPWRWSVPINVVSVLFAVTTAFAWLPTEHYQRVAATLFVALVFSSLFSYNIERQQAVLKDLVVTDPLTGAFNRRYFDWATAEARRHWRRTGHACSMILLDLDHFKKVNDSFGHAIGDRVLVALSQLIMGQLRPMDRFFRLGGEEFALLLPGTAATPAALLAERIRQQVESAPLAEGLPKVTLSCGVAELPLQGTLESWIDQCDEALYAAKNAGRNMVRVSGKVGDRKAISGASTLA